VILNIRETAKYVKPVLIPDHENGEIMKRKKIRLPGKSNIYENDFWKCLSRNNLMKKINSCQN